MIFRMFLIGCSDFTEISYLNAKTKTYYILLFDFDTVDSHKSNIKGNRKILVKNLSTN